MTASKLSANKLKEDSSLAKDSDSGHGPTSSSASNSSENVCNDIDEQGLFVDAADKLESANEGTAAANGDICCDENIDLQTTQLSSKSEGDEVGAEFEVGREDAEAEEGAELKVRLQESTVILKMALNNEFAKALEICERSYVHDLYAGLAHATLFFLRASLTLDRTDLQSALSSINRSYELSSRKRRRTSAASMVMRFLYMPDYNSYTDDEIHAELVHAESLLMLSLISFLADQSIICFVKGALRIRACYQRYKECLYIMDNRKNWTSEEARKHFESGVRMGYGVFNLLMSYLPRRVLRFLEYVGFSGNRSLGVDELEKSVASNDGLRSVFSALIILTYYSYIDNIFGLGNYDSHKVEQLNNMLLVDYPNSAFFLLFLGRYNQMEGDLAMAIENFNRCIEAQDDWKQFHSICHWEMMWCYAVQMDWKQAAHYADLLRKQCKWSAASYTYQYGTFLYAQLVEDERNQLCSIDSDDYKNRMTEIRQIIEQVPKLRIRYAGKTIPAEKFAITRSLKFCQRNNRLSLPALEFLYIWNIFVTLRNCPNQVERLLTRINSEIEHISSELNKNGDDSNTENEEKESNKRQYERRNDKQDSYSSDDDYNSWDDDLNLVLLLKGICLKHLNKLTEAEQIFKQIVENEPKIKQDTFLVPHSAMELSILKVSLREYDEAKHWIKVARTNYTGYLLETIVHFRLHAASREIRLEEQPQSILSSSSLELTID